jgi:hypothetical protein
MGREVRMVPPDWQHPKNEEGRYIPLLSGSFAEARQEWIDETAKYPPDLLRAKWKEGLRRSWKDGVEWEPIDAKHALLSCEAYCGSDRSPGLFDYMPDFEPGTATHYCMYESTSEGTPISPPMATPEELARWLADTKASAFAGEPASYEDWLATIRAGSAPSAVFSSEGGLQAGVTALSPKP